MTSSVHVHAIHSSNQGIDLIRLVDICWSCLFVWPSRIQGTCAGAAEVRHRSYRERNVYHGSVGPQGGLSGDSKHCLLCIDPVSHCCCPNWKCTLQHTAFCWLVIKSDSEGYDRTTNWYQLICFKPPWKARLGLEHVDELMRWDFLFWFFESQFMSPESCGSGMKWTSSGGLDLCSRHQGRRGAPISKGCCVGGRRWYFLKKHARCINVQLYILQECGVNNIHHYHCCGKKEYFVFLSLWRPWRTQGNLWAQLWIGK